MRELARALTGFRNDWSNELGNHNFRYDATGTRRRTRRCSARRATSTGRTRCACASTTRCTPRSSAQAVDLLRPDAARRRDARRAAGHLPVGGARSGRWSRRSSCTPPSTTAPDGRSRPSCGYAGLLRAIGRGVDAPSWSWLSIGPASGSSSPRASPAGTTRGGWTPRPLRGRWVTCADVLRGAANPWGTPAYDPAEEPAAAVAKALAVLGQPPAHRRDAGAPLGVRTTSVSPSLPSGTAARTARCARTRCGC